ncbi:hypothetical protein ABW21_db0209453 [Orbilia brochopaga]|nr:hypothetical protein ABW21_db0209453 [Drechslerella brochopaga]
MASNFRVQNVCDSKAQFRLAEYMSNLVLLSESPRMFIGVLEQDVQRALLDALKLVPVLTFEGDKIPDKILRSCNKKRKKSNDFDVSVNVYSPQRMADTIGTILGRKGLYLQPPDYLPEGINYYNPHFYSIQGELNPLPASVQTPNLVQPIQINYANVFDTSLENRISHDVWIDARMKALLRTELLEYENDVTGQRTSLLPSEQKGGIIADEMGMGKTLTVLSLIAFTLEGKNNFKQTESKIDVFAMDEDVLKQPKGGTLVIVTPSLLGGWKEELEKHFWPGTISVDVFHGNDRNADESMLSEADIVLTTYNTLSAEWDNKKSTLHRIMWYRVVLDEAHIIRNHKTIQFQAVSTLNAESRWCISGTPIQNNLNDLQSLVSFLRVPSQDNYHYFFRDFIAALLKKRNGLGFENLRRLIQSICLRRRNCTLGLPDLTEELCHVELSLQEREQYRFLKEEAIKGHQIASKGDGYGTAYRTIPQYIVKRRILCNLGMAFLQYKDIPAVYESEPFFEDVEADCAECQCNIGILGTKKATLTICGHWICSDCLPNYTLSIGKAASTAHLLEPQWNPMIEKQAIGRIQRLGQENPVKVIRYIVRDSIEEKILTKQVQKLRLAEMHMKDESPHESCIEEELKELQDLF